MSITLSAQQQAVVNFVANERGSLRLVARAGCGKTFTLLQVIKTIREQGKGEIVAMAFNKAIADELQKEIGEMGIDWKAAEAKTVHGLGNRAWRKIAPNCLVEEKKVLNIIDRLVKNERDDSGNPLSGSIAFALEDFGPLVAKLVGFAKGQAFGHLVRVSDTQAWLALFDRHGLEEDLTGGTTPEGIVKAAQFVYDISLAECRRIIDYDDMILAPLVFKARFWPKDWVLVDEAQDTNPARRALALALLKPRTGRMIFVGDDRQAIYGFTGADSDSMDQLQAATSAATLYLTETYRCPKVVVALAQRFVPDFVALPQAPEGIYREMTQPAMLEEKWTSSDAILCRNTAPLVSTAYRLLAKGTACRIEGREIGVGLKKLATRWKLSTLSALLGKLEEYEERESAKLMSKGKESQVEALKDKVECLRVIISRCTLQQKHSLNDLLASIDGMFGDTKDGEKPRVCTLSTVHKAKGREWPRVVILGRSRFMPSPYAKKDWQVVSEENLIYVAMTRSKGELIEVPYSDESAKEA